MNDPNGQCVANISKETTEKEVIKIKGIYGYTAKMQGINLSGGQTNSLEFCQTMFNLPTLNDLLVEFNKTL